MAPSSPFDRTRFESGLPLYEARYRVELAEGLFTRTGFLAGDDALRLAALESALESDAGALIAARGGYGATRLLPALDVASVRRRAKWLVGFSDVTALHALWARAGLCSVHGPMIASLWEAEPETRARYFALLEGEGPTPLHGLASWSGGRAAGRLFGGNLTVLHALVGTPHAPPMDDDVVLALEDIGERPYRIDRMLTGLLQAGFFASVRAIVLGQFTDCGAGPDGVSAEAVLRERLLPLGVPIVANAPFGHVPDNHPLLFGAHAHVDGARGTVDFTMPNA